MLFQRRFGSILVVLVQIIFTPTLSKDLASTSSPKRDGKGAISNVVVRPPNRPSSSVGRRPTAVEAPKPSSTVVNEMLVPLNSTTALICEPIFNGNDAVGKAAVRSSAIWYRDGKPVARVDGRSNAVLDNRNVELEGPIPSVGFLIITKIQMADEGEYWCERQLDDTDAESRATALRHGEHSRLRVAFLDPLPDDARPQVRHETPRAGGEERYPSGLDERPILDETITIDCPEARGLPKPTVSWLFEGEPIDFSASRLEVVGNGSLVIRRFTPSDSGHYECVQANFVGKTLARVRVGLPLFFHPRAALHRADDDAQPHASHVANYGFSMMCMGHIRNGILWFLVGCLATSCVVLLYLLAGILVYKCSRRRRSQRRELLLQSSSSTDGGNTFPPPLLRHSDTDERTRVGRISVWRSLWHGDTTLMPGFRKVIAPAATIAARPADDR